ncbi:MAG: thiosulfate reductase cytochrome b subunit [Bermanella sp.]
MSDTDESNQALRMLLVFGVLLALLAVAGFMMWPLAVEFAGTQLTPGLGMRSAALISFFVTVLTMVVFTFLRATVLLAKSNLCWQDFSRSL